MADISSISSANQYGMQQLRLQQARRNAEQAEQAAVSLKAQADRAQADAERANESARVLTAQSNQAQAQAGKARQGLAAASTASTALERVGNAVEQAISREPVAASYVAPAQAGESSAPVVNTQGQVTGTIVNTTA